MYRLIIVDDEKLIRMGMKKAVAWNTIGISEVFLAKSGTEALSIVKKERPQIMITDINMEDMTGLELIGFVKEVDPDIRIIVITGYDKFEYARRCIKLKVHDFFLKPLDEASLVDAVKKQISFLDDILYLKQKNRNINRAQAVVEQMTIEMLLRDIVHKKTNGNAERIYSFCEKYHYDIHQKMQIAILVPSLSIDDGYTDDDFTILTIKNICIGLVDTLNRGITFVDDYGRIAIAFFLKNQKESILEWLQALNDILHDEYNKKLKIVVGNPVDGLAQLPISYNDAVYLLMNEKEELDDIIQTKYAQKRERMFREIFSEMKNTMCTNIGDSEKVLKIFEYFSQATISYNLSDSYKRRCCFELAAAVYYMYLANTNSEADSKIIALMKSLFQVSDEELLMVTKLFLTKLLGTKEDQTVHELIDKAKLYISDHLSDELSVSSIASTLFISANYFSRLFKKVTGEGCNEYIVRKRIEKAKLLLETTNFKTNKIAMLVGYRDTNYFSLAIKKNTGMSPTKYREKHQTMAISLKLDETESYFTCKK